MHYTMAFKLGDCPKKLIVDLTVVVLVNFLLFSVCASHENDGNVSDTTYLVQKTHRTNVNSNLTPSPVVQEIGNFINWFFGSSESNKTNDLEGTSPATPRPEVRPIKMHTSIIPESTTKQHTLVEFEERKTVQSIPRYSHNTNNSSALPASRQIEITDIQTAIGTELPNGEMESDPSQINLQDELVSIDKFEKKVSHDFGQEKSTSRRMKRQLPINGIKRPYLNPNSNLQKRFSNRQGLLMSPAHQMLAIQQQQAAALLQQQALQQGIGYRRPYFYDDYNDDSDYDDSDSLEDDDSMGFYNPVRDGMRRGTFYPPMGPAMRPYMGGIGRRSVDNVKLQNSQEEDSQDQIVESPELKLKSPRKKSGALRRDGDWVLLDDYDLSSDFHKARNGFPLGKSQLKFRNGDAIERTGLAAESSETKPCEGKRCGKQGDNITNTTSSPGDSTTASGSMKGNETQPSTPTTPGSPLLPTAVPGGPMNSSVALPTGLPDNSTVYIPATPSPMTDNSTEMNPESTTEDSSQSSTDKPMGEMPPYKANSNCRCGAQSIRGEMITRGTVIRVQTNPWLFAISNKNKHLCSGTLINNRYVLTSAQCVHGINKNHLSVTGGLATRSSSDFTVNRVIIHPGYTSRHSANNLALLRLTKAIAINQMMRPICLPLSAQSRAPVNSATLNTWYKKGTQRQMIQTEVKILAHEMCNDTAVRGQLCTSAPGKTECGGDTGGSLQVSGADYSYHQIGVVAHTVGCRSKGQLGVHTDVRNYTRWILTETKDARYCNKPRVSEMELADLTDIESRADINQSEEEEEDGDYYDDFQNIF